MATPLASSFRDPSAYVFREHGRVFRRINASGLADFHLLEQSGLQKLLHDQGLLIQHKLLESTADQCLIEPQQLPFVSYPYEWCFSMLRDAALLTLRVQMAARQHGMTLKDASAYNVQFLQGKPVFIDTTSFTAQDGDAPWQAYRQFCQHFLAPLLLIAYRDHRLLSLTRNFLDGIPLDLAATLLPWRTRWRPAIYLHLHLHASLQKKHAADGNASPGAHPRRPTVKLAQALLMLEQLQDLISSLRWQPSGTEWADYYDCTNYSDQALTAKKVLVEQFLEQVQPASLWDLGANNGLFTRLAAARGIESVAFDLDPAATEKNYLHLKKHNLSHLLPLICDLNNPSPDLGWELTERDSLLRRGPADAVLALALVHHMAISNNVPLPRIAQFLASLTKNLLIEFVPKNDSQAQILLATRPDTFPDYNYRQFLQSFQKHFQVVAETPLPGSERMMVQMRKIT